MAQVKGTLIFCSPNPIDQTSPRQARELEIFVKENIPIVIVDSIWVYKGKYKEGVFPLVKRRKTKFNDRNIDTYSVKMIITPLYQSESNSRIVKILSLLQLFPSLIVYALALFFVLLHTAKKYNAKVIWCSNAPDLPCTIVGLLKFVFKNRFLYIYEMRELAPELYCIRLSGNAHCVFYRLLRILERISYSAADIVITVSHAMKKYIMKIYDEKKTIIPVYPYPPIPEEVYDKTCETSHFPRRSITAIYGGSMLDRIYDIDLLLHSLRDLYLVVKGRFKIMFSGKGDATIIHAIKQAKREMPEIIDVFELLPRKKYYELLRKSDLCIVPLVLNQLTSIAIPNKLIDCILLGKPVITAALPSTIELTYKFNGILLYKPGSLYSLERTLLGIVENESTLETINNKLKNQYAVFSEAWNRHFYPVVKAIHEFMKP